MNSLHQFKIKLGEPLLEKFADPPEDILGELSHLEKRSPQQLLNWRFYFLLHNLFKHKSKFLVVLR